MPIQSVISAGETLKSRTAKPIAIASASPSAITPRTTGSLKRRFRAIGERIGWCTCAISPLGLRTATAQFEGPRIITPSRTACPPIVALMRRLTAAGGAGLLEPALETLHPAAGIHQLLLARVEGVAVRADLDVQLRF